MIDEDDINDTTPHALTWHGPEDRLLYWSITKGWTDDPETAWVLTKIDIDRIEDDERLLNNLPQKLEYKDGANWEPLYSRFTYARGVINDDDDDETFNNDRRLSDGQTKVGLTRERRET